MAPTLEEFRSMFHFDPSRAGFVGVEREFFLVDATGRPVPRSPDFLRLVASDPLWTYELSACQVEHRTPPCHDEASLASALEAGDAKGQETARSLGVHMVATEVAPSDMPLDNYPEPRYARLRAEILSPERYLAACRVTGTHVHYGVGSMEEALAVYNRLTKNYRAFLAAGDGSRGERQRLYRCVAPVCDPPIYASVEEFHARAVRDGFATNPRDCWDFVRISRHGSVEVRAFGAPRDTLTVLSWARLVCAFATTR